MSLPSAPQTKGADRSCDSDTLQRMRSTVLHTAGLVILAGLSHPVLLSLSGFVTPLPARHARQIRHRRQHVRGGNASDRRWQAGFFRDLDQ